MALISRSRYKLICSSLICLIFIIIEVVGGVLSNSLAIATNALHLFTDLLTFIISLIAIWVAGIPTSQRMSFGWHRAEILGSFVSILISWGLTGILVYMAGVRVIFFFSEVKMDLL